jgi:hypothetical protein
MTKNNKHWTIPVRRWVDRVNADRRLPAPVRSALVTTTRQMLDYERTAERDVRAALEHSLRWGRARLSNLNTTVDRTVRQTYTRLGLATRRDIDRIENKMRAMARD